MLFVRTEATMPFLLLIAFLWSSFGTDGVYSKQQHQHQTIKVDVMQGRRQEASNDRNEWMINHALELLLTDDKSSSKRLGQDKHKKLTGTSAKEVHTYSAINVLRSDDLGRNHVRFERRYKGLRVIGGDLVLHMDEEAKYVGTSQTLRGEELLEVDVVEPRISAEAATKVAIAAHGGALADAAIMEGLKRRLDRNPEVVVYARDGVPLLAWDVAVWGTAPDKTPMTMHVIVDATVGASIDAYSDTWTLRPTGRGRLDRSIRENVVMAKQNLEDPTTSNPWGELHNTTFSRVPAKGVGRTDYVGQVRLGTNEFDAGDVAAYGLINWLRGNHITSDALNSENFLAIGNIFAKFENVWGDSTAADRETHAADAHYAQQVSWDYFLNVHDRLGIYDNGVGSYSRVHFSTSYANAFWWDGCGCMTYGDGDDINFSALVSLDVGGHELTHGVTSNTANLIYAGESGGLNEATSDIFGTMVEFYANNAFDTPDYLMGEMISLQPPFYLRTMINPSDDGRSFDCWFPNIGLTDVHFSSGVANHFFFLLAEGTVNGEPSRTCQLGIDQDGISTGSSTVTGIGREIAEQIWYRTLTVYMTTDTNYHQAFDATVMAATDFYGYPSQEVNAVVEAWVASGVDGDLPPPPTPTPPVSSSSSKSSKSGKQSKRSTKTKGGKQTKTKGRAVDGVNPSETGAYSTKHMAYRNRDRLHKKEAANL